MVAWRIVSPGQIAEFHRRGETVCDLDSAEKVVSKEDHVSVGKRRHEVEFVMVAKLVPDKGFKVIPVGAWDCGHEWSEGCKSPRFDKLGQPEVSRQHDDVVRGFFRLELKTQAAQIPIPGNDIEGYFATAYSSPLSKNIESGIGIGVDRRIADPQHSHRPWHRHPPASSTQLMYSMFLFWKKRSHSSLTGRSVMTVSTLSNSSMSAKDVRSNFVWSATRMRCFD